MPRPQAGAGMLQREEVTPRAPRFTPLLLQADQSTFRALCVRVSIHQPLPGVCPTLCSSNFSVNPSGDPKKPTQQPQRAAAAPHGPKSI